MCFMVRHFTREHGNDFNETFALVAKMTIVHTLVTIAAILK